MITLRFRNVTVILGTETPIQLLEDLLAKPDPPDLRGRGHRVRYPTAINGDQLKQHLIFMWMQYRELEREVV